MEEKIFDLRRENLQKEAPFRGQVSFWKRENVRITAEKQERTSGGLTFCEQLLYGSSVVTVMQLYVA